MVKFLDLEISTARFALRVVYGTVVAGMMLFVLYYVPSNLDQLISRFVPGSYAIPISNAVSSLVGPVLPLIGIALGVLTFLEILFKGTWIYGAFVLLLGATCVTYDYVFFHGGILSISIPAGIAPNISGGSFSLQLSLIMVLLMIPSILTAAKGGLLLARGAQKTKTKEKELVPVVAGSTKEAEAGTN